MRRLRTTFLRAATLRYDRAMLISARSSAYSSDVKTTESISSTACQETDEFVSDCRRRLSTAFSRETDIIRLQTEYFGKAFHFRFLSGERTLELLLPPYAANGENIPAAVQRTSCDRVSLIPGRRKGALAVDVGRRSCPAMYGILLESVQLEIRERYGDDAWRRVLVAAGLSAHSVFEVLRIRQSLTH